MSRSDAEKYMDQRNYFFSLCRNNRTQVVKSCLKCRRDYHVYDKGIRICSGCKERDKSGKNHFIA